MPRPEVRSRNRSGRLGVVIVAAGSSRRMAGVNKVFAALRGKPLIAWSVDACNDCGLVQQIVLVLNDKDLARGRELKEQRRWRKVTLCRGGTRRQDSVQKGLRQIRDCDWVMIHDGARPFLTPKLIVEGLKAAEETGAAIAAVPAKDTMKVAARGKFIRETLPRGKLWAAQTPQVFSLDMITMGYDNLQTEATDDSAAVELLGYRVKLYVGDHKNIKVTTREDLALARVIAREWKQKN